MNRSSIIVPVLLILSVMPVWGGAVSVPKKPAGGDKCPVCGMFVAKYPDFAAQIKYSDGKTVHFDGAKDLFRYYLTPGRYSPGRKGGEMVRVYVTSYYTLTAIDAKTAWYVTGSDVLGPMGRELIPFGKEAEAREFLADHKGRRLLRFRDITASIVRELE